ncbi:hypothetical protein ABT218_07265 [Streptomyces sp. NPDC001455]|uniref:hypothetical protein n=1 Tax=Streptomyces sp. NPDC001455 TaxID=3154518 RepID=UPI003321416D
MPFIPTTLRQRRLGAADAAVVIIVILVVAVLAALTSAAVPTPPVGVPALLTVSFGLITLRLATTGLVDLLLILVARILASARPLV